MRRALVPWVTATMAAGLTFVAACGSADVDPFGDGGFSEDALVEAGHPAHDAMNGFDQFQVDGSGDSTLPDSTDGTVDAPPDVHDETVVEDVVVFETGSEDFEGGPDVVFEVGSEDMFEGGTEDVFEGGTEDVFEGGTEDMFEGGTEDDVGSEDAALCPLPDGDTSVFPIACASCLEESCCTQLTACEGVAGCHSIANCIGQCLTMGGTNCVLTCYDAGDAGKSQASQLINCLNSSCASSSDPACR
jgi:hypothetical protein